MRMDARVGPFRFGPGAAPVPRAGPDHPPERLHLFDDHPLHPLGRVLLLEPKVELGRARRLVGRVVPDAQVRVLQRLCARDPPGGVEGEKAGEQVVRERVRVRVQVLVRDPALVGQRTDVVLSLCATPGIHQHSEKGPMETDGGTHAGGADPAQGRVVGRAEVVQDLVELVDIVAALEDRPAAEELGEDATDRPQVDFRLRSTRSLC